MPQRLKKFLLWFTPREFVATMSVIVACICVVFKPERVETVRTVVMQVAAMFFMSATAIGYAIVEKRHTAIEKKPEDTL